MVCIYSLCLLTLIAVITLEGLVLSSKLITFRTLYYFYMCFAPVILIFYVYSLGVLLKYMNTNFFEALKPERTKLIY